MSAEANVPDEAVPTADDTRRALEALGFQRGTDQIDLTRRALDAYSVVWVPSRNEQRHHEQGILEAVVAAAPLIVAAELERIAGVEDGVIDEMTERRDERKRSLDNMGIDPESDPTYAGLYGVVHARSAIVRKIRERVAELRGESR